MHAGGSGRRSILSIATWMGHHPIDSERRPPPPATGILQEHGGYQQAWPLLQIITVLDILTRIGNSPTIRSIPRQKHENACGLCDKGDFKPCLPLIQPSRRFFLEITLMINHSFYALSDSLLHPGAGLYADPAHHVAAAVDVAVD